MQKRPSWPGFLYCFALFWAVFRCVLGKSTLLWKVMTLGLTLPLVQRKGRNRATHANKGEEWAYGSMGCSSMDLLPQRIRMSVLNNIWSHFLKYVDAYWNGVGISSYSTIFIMRIGAKATRSSSTMHSYSQVRFNANSMSIFNANSMYKLTLNWHLKLTLNWHQIDINVNLH